MSTKRTTQTEEQASTTGSSKSISYLMNTKNWWQPLLFILIISVAGVGLIGFQTYVDAPPMTGFKTNSGEILMDKTTIERGQIVFHKYALMEYGSFFGDGAQRGPDFTAEALHLVTVYMNEYDVETFKKDHGRDASDMEKKIIGENIKTELKANHYNKAENIVILSDAQAYALGRLKKYYTDLYIDDNPDGKFPPNDYITDRAETADLASFFFWGAWVCVTERPGTTFSYTHNLALRSRGW